MKTKITRALPPYRRKRIKIQKNDGVVSIALAAASQVPENDSHQNMHAQENRTIPVVVAAGSSRHKRTASNLSVDFDLSQPPEPEHWFPGLVQALSQPEDQDEPMDLPSDATVDALLETILPPLEETPEISDSTENDAPSSFLREGYLRYFYMMEAMPVDAECAGRTCRAAARLAADDSAAAAESPSDAAPSFQLLKPEYRCCNCISSLFFCETCIVADHSSMPLHRIERWNGSFFERGPVDQPQVHQYLLLGHSGARCPSSPFTFGTSRPVESILTVVHVNGYHKLQVRYCCCPSSPEPYVQLVLARLFPATHARPATAFTFQLLQHFQRINLASKTAAHDYHKALLQLSDPVQPNKIPSAYHQFVDVMRQWRALATFQSSGKLNTSQAGRGELATACPACPHPGINLPEGWENHPNRQLLYGRFLSGDGNFHLVRRRNRAGTGKDGDAAAARRSSMLGDGAFWVPQREFDQYIQNSKAQPKRGNPQKECNTIAGDPFKQSATASAKNDVSGVFTMSCRHVIVCANGVCDFTKGEGFHFVDVPMSMVIKAAIDEGLKDLVISYDIACKYSINFLNRVCESPYPLLPSNLQSLVSILWLIGKFHLGGHREECQKMFNFNYTKGVGRMSGELVETIWSYFDYLKYQTREMGPGSRQEMLSDAMNYWNWQKIVKLSDATRATLIHANVQTENAQSRLKGLEEYLGPELVKKLSANSEGAGNDQYLPDKGKTKFPSQKSVLATLLQDEANAGNLSHETLSAQQPKQKQASKGRRGGLGNRPRMPQHSFPGPAAASSFSPAVSAAPLPQSSPPLPPHRQTSHHQTQLPGCINDDGNSDFYDTEDSDMEGSARYSAAAPRLFSSPIRPQRRQQRQKHINPSSNKQTAASQVPIDDDEEVSTNEDGNEDQSSDEASHSQSDHQIDEAEKTHQREMDAAKLNWLNGALRLETTQAKYIQLLSQQSANSLPGLKSTFQEKLKNQKSKLESGLSTHYSFLRSIGSGIVGIDLTPKEAHKDPIIVPSRLSPRQRQTYGLQRLAKQEKQLRIGQAFDALVQLRKALGVRSFLTRHARKSNGYNITTRAQETLKRAELTVKQWAAAYRRCWDALVRLEASDSELKGLRALNQEDLVLLSTWLEEEKYRDRGTTLPWIWTVAPLPQQNQDVAASVQEWSEEIVRLEWVHAKAALDRWIEENHLLREELGRIALFFRWAYQDWSDKANDLSQGEGERVICGYRAFTLRKADDYKRLVHNALDNLSLAGLDLPFQYL